MSIAHWISLLLWHIFPLTGMFTKSLKTVLTQVESDYAAITCACADFRLKPSTKFCSICVPGEDHSPDKIVKVKVKSLSRVRPSATPRAAAHQAPPSMGFSRQEYWSGVPLPSSLSHSTVFLYFFVLFILEGLLISPWYSLELCIQLGISFPFS